MRILFFVIIKTYYNSIKKIKQIKIIVELNKKHFVIVYFCRL